MAIDPQGEQAVDQGAVDDQVNLVEPVAGYRDRGRGGDAQDGQVGDGDDRLANEAVLREEEPQHTAGEVCQQQKDQGVDQPLHLLPLQAG
jgi:hypothetical protein